MSARQFWVHINEIHDTDRCYDINYLVCVENVQPSHFLEREARPFPCWFKSNMLAVIICHYELKGTWKEDSLSTGGAARHCELF